MDRILFRTLSLLVTTHSYAYSQLLPSAINLGSVSLQRAPFTGDLRLGVGQGANIFGFGGERQIGLNFGPGRFGTQIDNGLFLGGQRFGVDSHLGYQQGRGIDLGSILNFQNMDLYRKLIMDTRNYCLGDSFQLKTAKKIFRLAWAVVGKTKKIKRNLETPDQTFLLRKMSKLLGGKSNGTVPALKCTGTEVWALKCAALKCGH
uniref:Secreted protein n=1 Tax=Globodera pallida TaxID=36090 RepID=A0A183CKK8_GLOPA